MLRLGLATLLACVPSAAASARPLLTTQIPDAVASRQAALVGEADVDARMTLQVVLPMRHRGELAEFTRAVSDPASPLFRHYLSVAEFTKRFGPGGRTYDAAARFFDGNGLKVTGRAANRYLLQIEGRVADIERTFHVKMNLYRHPTESRIFVSPDREPALDLAVPVLYVAGLDDFDLPRPKFSAPGGGRAHAWQGSGPHGNYIGSDFRAAYYGDGPLTGAGQSVGLFEFHGYALSDVALYFQTVGESSTVPVDGVSVDGTEVDCGHCADGEQILDIVYAASMAPGLKRIQAYVGRSAVAILNRMASDNTSRQISVSWGWHKNFDVEDPIYQEMIAQGQTLLIASGDYSSLKASGQWPEEDANLVAVGGTDLVTDGPGGAWASETGWNASGGGPSLDKSIRIEPYQLPFINRKNAGSTKLRNVPDVSANANYNMYTCHKQKCTGGWGGTSFSAPMWAGFIAMANEQAAKESKPAIGFFNPLLYELMRSDGAILHDPVRHRSGEYATVKGYDLVTGLGSLNGQALIDALLQAER